MANATAEQNVLAGTLLAEWGKCSSIRTAYFTLRIYGHARIRGGFREPSTLVAVLGLRLLTQEPQG